MPDPLPKAAGEDDFAGLVLRTLDGLASPDEQATLCAELAADPERRAMAVTLCRQHGELVELLRSEHEEEHFLRAAEVLGPRGLLQHGAPAPRPAYLRFAALAAVALALVVALRIGFRAEPVAHLEQVEGDVAVVTAGGEERPGRPGDPLFLGEGLRTPGEENLASVRYGDGTRLELGSGTTVAQLADETGKRVVLSEGLVTVEAVRQPAGRPLVLSSPHAEVVVRGTAFTCTSGPDATQIEVVQGSVEFRRRTDGRSIEVQAGQRAAVLRSEPDRPDIQPAVDRDLFVSVPLPSRQVKSAGTIRHGTTPVQDATVSADGRLLAVATNHRLTLLELPGGKVRWTVTGRERSGRCLAFSPDNRLLASGGSDGMVRLRDRDNGRERAVLSGHTGRINSLTFSPDGATLATAAGHFKDEGEVFLWEVATGELRRRFDSQPHGMTTAAFSPDGAVLAAGGHDPRILLWDPHTGAELGRLEHRGGGRVLAYSPDGRLLASGGNFFDRTINVWDMAERQLRTTLSGHLHELTAIAFSPDGRLLATGSADKTVRLWEIEAPMPDSPWAVLSGLRGPVAGLAFSPDGKLLATAAVWQREITLWDVPPGDATQ